MIRGTTPTHTFRVPIDTATISELRIIYSQNGMIAFVKELWDCTISEKKISCKLTQEDTFMLSDNSYVQIQMRVLLADGNLISSKVRNIPVAQCLDNEVMGSGS